MEFVHPTYLAAGLLILISIVTLFWISDRISRRLATIFAHVAPIEEPILRKNRTRRRLRRSLFLLAITLLVLSLARPFLGTAWQEATTESRDIVILVDVSRSMAAEDILPSRLDRSRLAIGRLVDSCPGDRVAIVPFAGTAFLQCPLTYDHSAVRQTLDLLEVGLIPTQGTRLGEALRIAGTAFDLNSPQHRAIVVFSDGEEHDDDATQAASTLKDLEVKIFCVGVGTQRGALLSETINGRSEYIRDSGGNPVRSALQDELLLRTATVGNGFYLELTSSETIPSLLRNGLEPMPRIRGRSSRLQQKDEWFQLPLLLSFLCISAFAMIRPTSNPAATGGRMAPSRNRDFVGTVGATLLALLLQQTPIIAETGVIGYNEGVRWLQSEDFEKAKGAFDRATRTSNLHIQKNAFYNLGLCHLREAMKTEDLKIRKGLLEASIDSFEAVLDLDPSHRSSARNTVIASRHLNAIEELEQQTEASPDSKQNPDGSDDQKQEQEQQTSSDEEAKNQQEQKNPDDSNRDSSTSDKENQKDSEAKARSAGTEGEEGKQDSSTASGDSGKEEGSENGKDAREAAGVGQMTLQQALKLLNASRQRPQALPAAQGKDIPKDREGNGPTKTW